MKRWLDEILKSNERFLIGTKYRKLNTKRSPGPHAIVTCMDPRINLNAIEIDSINWGLRDKENLEVLSTSLLNRDY